MASVASQLIAEVIAHAQSDSLEDAREICAGGTYFPNNLRICSMTHSYNLSESLMLVFFLISPKTAFLNCRAAARYRALASIIPGRERFSWNLSF